MLQAATCYAIHGRIASGCSPAHEVTRRAISTRDFLASHNPVLLNGLCNCETEKVEQFVRIGRIHSGQIAVEKVQGRTFSTSCLIKILSNAVLIVKEGKAGVLAGLLRMSHTLTFALMQNMFRLRVFFNLKILRDPKFWNMVCGGALR